MFQTANANIVLRRSAFFGALFSASALLPLCSAHANGFEVLHTFTGKKDGGYPWGALVMDKTGNLYGTSWIGGQFKAGTVFRFTRSGKETVLHSFDCSTEGCAPDSRLLLDKSGNFYGAAPQGGVNGYGGFFELAPNGDENVILFVGNDGGSPNAGLIRDAAGNLYGTASGGTEDNPGTVFEVASGSGTITTLFAFDGLGDGGVPEGDLVRDKQGNLYGTTLYGGASDDGVVFRLRPGGKEEVLHSFGGADGNAPGAGLIMDRAGNLYGTTSSGGANDDGTVFRLAPDGTETVLHSFTGNDGAEPLSDLVMDGAGNLYGTAAYGGLPGYGVVFKLAPDGTETLLHAFRGTDGREPFAGLVADGRGHLYGTTAWGGAYDSGTVFRVSE